MTKARNISILNTVEAGATADQTKADIEGLGIAASSITGTLPAISGANLTGVNTSNLLNMEVINGPFSRSDSNSWVDSTAITYTTVDSSSTILIIVDIEATMHMWGSGDQDAMYAVQLLRVSPSAATIAKARQWYEYPNSRVGGGNSLADWTNGPQWNSGSFSMAAKFSNPATAGSDITFKLQQADAAPSVFDLNTVTYSIWEFST